MPRQPPVVRESHAENAEGMLCSVPTALMDCMCAVGLNVASCVSLKRYSTYTYTM